MKIETKNCSKCFNKNCWLVNALGYAPYGRCQFCDLKFRNCLFLHYQIISIVLIIIFFGASFLIYGRVSELVIISVFILSVVYGYFFNKSTDKIIRANFSEKKAKEALGELNKNLEKRVREQTKEIRKAYEVEKEARQTLEKTNDAKNQFIMATQHHLRTPLSITMGFLDLLLGGHFGKMPKKVLETIQKSQQSIQKEIEVVDDLLNVSAFQLGHGYVQLQPCIPIRNMLEEIVADLVPVAEKKEIYLKFESEDDIPEITVDRKQIKMALQNIVDNAIKYTKKGGVVVKINLENDRINIEVKDTGIGMDENDKKYLFEKPFQRSEEAWSANATGKGIGVYLSAQIIKAHGGDIKADSAGRGKGSTFNIELPVDATPFANKKPISLANGKLITKS